MKLFAASRVALQIARRFFLPLAQMKQNGVA